MSDNIFNTSYDNSNESTGDTVDSSSHNEYDNNILNVIEEETLLISNAEEGIQSQSIVNNNYVYTQIPNNSENTVNILNNDTNTNLTNSILTNIPSLNIFLPESLTNNIQNNNTNLNSDNTLLNITETPQINNAWSIEPENTILNNNPYIITPPIYNFTGNQIVHNSTTELIGDDSENDSFSDMPSLEDTSDANELPDLPPLELSNPYITSFNTLIPNFNNQTNLIEELPPIIENDNLDENPFAEYLIKPLEYNSEEEEDINDKYILVIFSWLFEINYDYYSIKNVNIYTDKKNRICKSQINKIRHLRSNRNQRVETGEVLKLKNILKLKKNDYVWLYLIIYYDNIKCNVEFYGIFNEEPDEDILINQIIDEKKYGSICNVVNVTQTAINSNGFNLLPYKIKID
jgi:hypothetical protein